MGNSTECLVLVSYESLLAALSRQHLVDMVSAMEHIAQKVVAAHSDYQIIVAADWERFPTELAQLTECGYQCMVTTGSTTLNQVRSLIGIVKTQIAAAATLSTVIVVGGDLDYVPLIDAVQAAALTIGIWTLSPPPEIRTRCDSWEKIGLASSVSAEWPRAMLLHAVLVAARTLQTEERSPIDYDQLVTALVDSPRLGPNANAWINIAIQERVLLFQRAQGSAIVHINYEHALTRMHFNVFNHIIATATAMSIDRAWVAFGALARTLGALKPLAQRRRLRHVWLQMLLEARVFSAEQLPNPNATHFTTALTLNTAHPLVVNSRLQQYFRLARLIVVADNFFQRRKADWIAISELLRRLTGPGTRLEARAALTDAQLQKVGQIHSIPSLRAPERSVTVFDLMYEHPLVIGVLDMRNRIVFLYSSLLKDRYQGLAANVLTDELTTTFDLGWKEARFWSQLLIEQAILETVQVDPNAPVMMGYQLRLGDPVVNAALITTGQDNYGYE